MAPSVNKSCLTTLRKQTVAVQQGRSFVVEARLQRWRQQKQQLISANCTQKSLTSPRHGYFQELEQEIIEFLHVKKKTGVRIA